MKKLLTFVIFIITLAFPTQSVFAADTSPGPNTAPMLKPWAVINSNNTVTVFWNQISDVKEYRICLNQECNTEDNLKKWFTYQPSQNSATFPLEPNETKRFHVHAWLTDNATNYNTLDLRPCCNGIKWANRDPWIEAVNAPVVTTTIPQTTTTVPETTTNTLVIKKDQKIPLKDLINTTTTIDYSHELENSGLLLGSPTTTIDWVETVFVTNVPKTITTTPKIITNKKEPTMFGLKENEFFVIASLFLIAFIYIIATQINRWKIEKMRFQLEVQASKIRLELEVKEKEFNFESKSYELKELAKSKLNNEHEVALKKIDSSATTDQLEFTERQLNNERNHNLEQQRINANNADKILEYVMPIVQKRDAHELRMAEIKSENTFGSIIETDDIKSGTVKLNIKK